MSKDQSGANKLILGAILGGVAVGTSAYFLSSKSGQAVKEYSADKWHHLKEQVEMFLQSVMSTEQSIVAQIDEKADAYTQKIHDLKSQIVEQMKELGTEENKEKLKIFLIGGVLGGMVGAATASCVSLKAENKTACLTNADMKVDSMKSTVQEILRVLDEKSSGSADHHLSNTLQDILDFVSHGIGLWQKMKETR